MQKTASIFLAALCLSLSAHAAIPFEEHLYKGVAVPFYKDGSNPEQQKLLEMVKRSQLAERMASVVNGTIRLKSSIGVGFESCGQVNAFYSPQRRAVVICLEFLQMVANTARNDTEFIMKLPREQFSQIIDGLLWSVYFHELAHAIINVNQVPVTGREEDVADQFAVWFAVNFVNLDRTPIIMPAIWFWGRSAQERSIPSMSEDDRKRFLSDEHSLDEVRIYNLACWALGTGAQGGAKTAVFAKLPEQRAQRCPAEYAQVDMGMKNRFKKYFKAKPLRGSW
jgi:hypothetical protein